MSNLLQSISLHVTEVNNIIAIITEIQRVCDEHRATNVYVRSLEARIKFVFATFHMEWTPRYVEWITSYLQSMLRELNRVKVEGVYNEPVLMPITQQLRISDPDEQWRYFHVSPVRCPDAPKKPKAMSRFSQNVDVTTLNLGFDSPTPQTASGKFPTWKKMK